MKGDERVRFCDLCSLHVYNIAELTANETKSLIANTEGRICARLFRRSDGTVITKDCPVGLRAIRRHVARIAGAVFATMLSLFGSAFGQKQPAGQCRQQVTISRTTTDDLKENGLVKGVVLDRNGAVIPGAVVALTELNSTKIYQVSSNVEGRFEFPIVTPGTYELNVIKDGFKNLMVRELKVAAKETISLETIVLTETIALSGILDVGDLVVDTPGKTVFTEKMIRSLPIP
jgi:hypothetical protein